VRLLFLSDSHLGFDLPVRPRVVRRRRGEDFFAMLDIALDTAVRARVDAVVHGGDVFFRSKVPPSIVDRVYARLLAFVSAHDIPLYLVPGNHERSRLPPSLLLAHPRVHVFDEPRVFTLDVGGARVALAGFPYVREIRARYASIAKALRAQARADVSAGFDAVLTGHIHRRQVLWREGVPVVYPGSIERTSFVEKDEPKGFFVIELRGAALFPRDLRFVRLPARPMFELTADHEDELCHRLGRLPADAVVRVTTRLPAARLRALAPVTMTVTSHQAREVPAISAL
jgi:DNA repair exonuclease SbcCD nuclease subunit